MDNAAAGAPPPPRPLLSGDRPVPPISKPVNHFPKRSTGRGRAEAAARRRRPGINCRGKDPAVESDDVRGEVERKIAALQRLVPGGEALGVEQLFEETADYILALRSRVCAMKLLANLCDELQREKAKMGG